MGYSPFFLPFHALPICKALLAHTLLSGPVASAGGKTWLDVKPFCLLPCSFQAPRKLSVFKQMIIDSSAGSIRMACACKLAVFLVVWQSLGCDYMCDTARMRVKWLVSMDDPIHLTRERYVS